MAGHKVFLDLDLPGTPVGGKDLIFKVYRNDRKFGELRVSRGAIVWRGSFDQDGRKMTWPQFDRLMESEAKRAERRKPGERIGVSPAKKRKY